MRISRTCPNARLTENVFKRISANSNIITSTLTLSNSHPNSNPNPNSKTEKPFWENEMTHFSGKCPNNLFSRLYQGR